MNPTVLLLSTYPIVEPRHGGQVRLANIAHAFEAANWQVESMAIYEPEGYGAQRQGPRDLPFPVDSPFRQFKGRDVPLVNDLLTGLYAAADDGGFAAVVRQLPPVVDAIHVEQPWLWPLAKRIKQVRGTRCWRAMAYRLGRQRLNACRIGEHACPKHLGCFMWPAHIRPISRASRIVWGLLWVAFPLTADWWWPGVCAPTFTSIWQQRVGTV